MTAEVPASRSRFARRGSEALGEPEAPRTAAGPRVGPADPPPSPGRATAGYRCAKRTPAEWLRGYRGVLERAAGERRDARGVQRDARLLGRDAAEETGAVQAEGTRLLGERLLSVHGGSSELRRRIERLRADADGLLALRRRLDEALDATDAPHAVATDNLVCRSGRPAPDLVRDCVEEELLKEVDLIRSVQVLLRRTTAQVLTQIRATRAAKQTLEHDWSDKTQAYSLDDLGGRMTNCSPDTRQHAASATMQDQVCNESSWEKFTQENISMALQEEQATEHLRMLVEQVLKDTAEDLRVQNANVERAFSRRCEELTEAKIQLEKELTQVLEQIGAQERNIVALQEAIHSKEAPLRVAQSRLYLRSLRPNMELCRDEPQLSLEEEVRQIHATTASLRLQLSEAEASLSRLQEARMALEKDITCKKRSLFIDRDKCMAQRNRLQPGR